MEQKLMLKSYGENFMRIPESNYKMEPNHPVKIKFRQMKEDCETMLVLERKNINFVSNFV